MMANRLPVPPDLLHLIEKRTADQEESNDRRSGEEQRRCDLGPMGALESIPSLDELPTEDRRSQTDRRVTGERRAGNKTPDDAPDSE